MRIIIASNSAAPSRNASSLQTARMCEQFSYLNHNVVLLLPNTGYKIDYFKYYNLKKNFKLERLKNFRKFPRGLSYYLFGLMCLFKILKQKPDLVITRNFYLSLLMSIVGQKHILEVHDTMEIEGRIVRFFQNKINYLNYSSLKKIICTTLTLKKFYTNKYGVKKTKLLVLHNASSIKYKKKIKPLPKKNFKIGFFGTIYDSRGLDLFIKISKKDKFNDYYIYGGSKKEIYKLKRENFNSNLHLNEYVSQKKFILELEKIDICLLPYTKKITVAGDVGDISKYTSPLKVFDYMKLGKLIISSDIEVLREVLNKKNSVLVKNYMNMLSWLNVLKKVKKNRVKYNEIKKNGHNFSNNEDAKWRAVKILESFN